MNTITLAMLGWPEIIGILIIVLVLFGARKVPELMRGLGTGIKEFKKATRDVQDEVERAIQDDPPPAPRPTPAAPKAPTVAQSSSDAD